MCRGVRGGAGDAHNGHTMCGGAARRGRHRRRHGGARQARDRSGARCCTGGTGRGRRLVRGCFDLGRPGFSLRHGRFDGFRGGEFGGRVFSQRRQPGCWSPFAARPPRRCRGRIRLPFVPSRDDRRGVRRVHLSCWPASRRTEPGHPTISAASSSAGRPGRDERRLCEPIEDPLRQFIARQKSRSLPSSWASISARATKPTMIASPPCGR